ncbi:MAG: hypothetical protein KME16_25020 [Scytolyngbya sp. HA4215-MV1]|jgi:trans-aconitate methyltransferase|nr:hypothetical protein [Scytolyngbya sp. HA4215-MV1]
MKPKFADDQTWQQAELLMQPAFIRLVDNLRKQMELSEWQGTYETFAIWAEGIPDEVKQTVLQLQSELSTASPSQVDEIERQLAQLPTSHPGYYLCLQQQDQQIKVDLWQLCYQICFEGYQAVSDRCDQSVVIDAHLIDDMGEVDWHQLETKTQQTVEQLFATLPNLGHGDMAKQAIYHE